jgi:type IX secretion system PorP/SprF family membrane protein
MKKYLLIFLCITALRTISFSQDMHFSQYNEIPSLVNPALTGSEYVMRAGLIYKNQWGSVTVPYRSYGASYEMKFKASAWDKTDPFKSKSYKKAFNRLAGGLSFFSDKAGDGGLGTNLVNLSLATFIKTSDNSMLSFGGQGSIIQRSVDFNKFVFSNQYNGTSYDRTPAPGEDYSAHSFIAPDVAAGVLWRYEKEEKVIGDNDHMTADFGASMYHIIKPTQHFLVNSNDQLYSKINVHGKMLIGIPRTRLGIAPSLYLSFQGAHKELLAGVMGKYFLKHNSKYTGYVKKSSIGIGAYYRNGDAVILNFLLEYAQYGIGVSYDLNVSGLSEVSTLRGGPEITLRYNTADRFLFQKK